jgi:hypothetical protein
MLQSSQHHQAETETLPELACCCALHLHSCKTRAHTEGKQIIDGQSWIHIYTQKSLSYFLLHFNEFKLPEVYSST